MLKKINVSNDDLRKYKSQSQNLVRRRVSSSKMQYSNIGIMTDADTDG